MRFMTNSIPQNPALVAAPAAGLRACVLPGLPATAGTGEFVLPPLTAPVAGLPAAVGEPPIAGVLGAAPVVAAAVAPRLRLGGLPTTSSAAPAGGLVAPGSREEGAQPEATPAAPGRDVAEAAAAMAVAACPPPVEPVVIRSGSGTSLAADAVSPGCAQSAGGAVRERSAVPGATVAMAGTPVPAAAVSPPASGFVSPSRFETPRAATPGDAIRPMAAADPATVPLPASRPVGEAPVEVARPPQEFAPVEEAVAIIAGTEAAEVPAPARRATPPPAASVGLDRRSLATAEKIAARAGIVSESPAPAVGTPEKTFLTVGPNVDVKVEVSAGITNAKEGGAMITEHPEALNFEANWISKLVEKEFNVGTDLHDFHPSLVAHRAVAAVDKVVDILTLSHLQQAPAVQIRLKLGNEDLSIRVAMRGNTVETQIRTTSSELCSAIAHQWAMVRAESSDRSLLYLEPEFLASHQPSAEGRPGGFGQSGHSPQREARPDESEVFGAVVRSYPYGQGAAAEPAPEEGAREAATSQHLSAVA